MFNKLIENYVNKMTIYDVNNFAKKNNIYLNNDELNIIYKAVKENWYTLIYGNYQNVFNSVKDSVNSETFKKIEDLYFYFKGKYQNYL